MKRLQEVPNTSATNTDYNDEDNIPQNVIDDWENFDDGISEKPYYWKNIIMQMTMSSILGFCILYLNLILNEITYFQCQRKKIVNNIFKIFFLLFVNFVIIYHIFDFRWNRNYWYTKRFDNYPMVIMMCIYALIELIYYILEYILRILFCNNWTYYVGITMELCFMILILSFIFISINNNVQKYCIWIRLRTKVIIMLTMVGCFAIFSRKTAIKIKWDYDNYNNNSKDIPYICKYNQSSTCKIFSNMCFKMYNFLEIADINFFIIAFILLINPLFDIDEHDECKDIPSISILPKQSFSMLNCLSLVRFRLFTVLVSLFFTSILLVAIYFYANVLIQFLSLSKNTTQITSNIFYSISIIANIFAIGYGLYYYFIEVQNWPFQEIEELNSDQYLNYLTASSQFLYISIILYNLYLTFTNDKILEIINYILLYIQIIIQADCIYSTTRRTVRRNTNTDVGSWKFLLIPPVFLASFNFISMILNIVDSQYIKNINFIKTIKNESVPWLFMKDVSFPLNILNRFHGMSFFINLIIKQW